MSWRISTNVEESATMGFTPEISEECPRILKNLEESQRKNPKIQTSLVKIERERWRLVLRCGLFNILQVFPFLSFSSSTSSSTSSSSSSPLFHHIPPLPLRSAAGVKQHKKKQQQQEQHHHLFLNNHSKQSNWWNPFPSSVCLSVCLSFYLCLSVSLSLEKGNIRKK